MGTITGRILVAVFGIFCLVLGLLCALDSSFHVMPSTRGEAFLPALPPAGEIGLGLFLIVLGVWLLIYVSREVTEGTSAGLVVAGVIVVATVSAVLVLQRVPHTRNLLAPPRTAAQATRPMPWYPETTVLLEGQDVLLGSGDRSLARAGRNAVQACAGDDDAASFPLDGITGTETRALRCLWEGSHCQAASPPIAAPLGMGLIQPGMMV